MEAIKIKKWLAELRDEKDECFARGEIDRADEIWNAMKNLYSIYYDITHPGGINE